MLKQILISGFGGQGALSIGKNLVEAAMEQGYYVTWAPSYGPEMRGGTANCSVVLSDKPIGSPLFTHPSELIAMNAPSLDKFLPNMRAGSAVFVNTSVVKDYAIPDTLHRVDVPCEEIAEKLGNKKVANMVMLGAYVAESGVIEAALVERMIHEMFTGAKANLVPLNLEAFHAGMACLK